MMILMKIKNQKKFPSRKDKTCIKCNGNIFYKYFNNDLLTAVT